MALVSMSFRGEPKLEAAAVSDPAHILQGSKGAHVQKIQAALIDLDQADLDLDGMFGPATMAAVKTYKERRRILNVQGRIDGIVGKKTMTALDAEMAALENGRLRGVLNLSFGIEVTLVDIVVRFRAGVARDALQNLDPGKLEQYRKKPNRRLLAITRTADIGNAGLIQGVVQEIDKELGALDELGVLCINGNSAGARNALELAAALKDKRKIKFVGLADMAMFPDLPGLNVPEPLNPADITGGKAKNVPFWSGAPSIDADIKQNFFQTRDNFWSRRNLAFKREWTGRTGDSLREVHGRVPGFADGGGTEIQVPLASSLGPGAHVFAGDEGDRRNGAKISELLAAL